MKAKKYYISRNKVTATRIGQFNESTRCMVYTIELDPSVAREPAFAAKNPKHVPGKPSFYVGMTSLVPEERFSQHITGSKNASRIVHKYGKALRMDMVGNNKPTLRTWALEREKRVAKNLRSQGFGAWKG